MLRAMLGTGMALILALPAPAAEQPGGSPSGRRMAVTIDDLPAQAADKLSAERIKAINAGILAALAAKNVPAIGFVNENKLEEQGELATWRVELLEHWLDAGLELGNHGFAHLDLHQVTLAAYQQDILDGQMVIKALLGGRQLPLRFFRHPYLHTGKDLRTKKAVERFLKDHHYQVAPVTIDNSEWVAAAAYEVVVARGDEAAKTRLAAAYLDYMTAMVEYYEGQSRAIVGREIPQILLIHANSLNGDHLAALLERIRLRGYTFVALGEALKDPAYASADTYAGPGGITWLHRWALTKNLDRALFATEPLLPSWIPELAGIEP